MKIKSREEPDVRVVRRWWRAATTRRWVVFGVYTVCLAAAAVAVRATGLLGRAADLMTRETVTHVYRRASGMLVTPPHLTIDIAHKDFMNLAHQRDVALARQVLVVTDADVVKASVRHGDQTVPVRLRLKGDLVDHLEGEKWSFRIMARGDATILGMKDFSVQHPATRAYLSERVYHDVMRREGLLALRYEFVDVTVNGKDLGVYALEESFETRLIEQNGRKDGPIVRFNEDILWGQLARQTSTPILQRGAVAGAGAYQSSDIDSFETTRWQSDPALRQQFVAAIQLLDGFRRNELTVSQVFDVKQLARFFALSDLLSAWHGVANWPNARFYYNPITARLEPVAFDGFDRMPPSRPSLLALRANDERLDPTGYATQFFADREFYRLYLAELERVSDPSYLQAVIAELTPALNRALRLIHRDHPDYEFSWAPIHRSAEFIRIALHPPKGIQAYLRASTAGSITLDVANISALPVRVVGLARDKERWPFEPVELAGKPVADRMNFEPLRFTVAAGLKWPDALPAPVRILYQVVGSDRVDEAEVLPYPHAAMSWDAMRGQIARMTPNAESFPFLTVDPKTRRIGIRPGRWQIDRPLVIPEGYRVFAGPGTRLDLVKGAAIVSRSALDWRGDAQAPVILESSDRTGQGLIVMQAAGRSSLDYVEFVGLSNPDRDHWTLTGAVTFYESAVDVRRSRFAENRSEDALHIMRTQFALDHVLFERTSSDALDIDFGTGTIGHARFIGIGNDGVDASGSTVRIEDMDVRGAGDKGVSAGEASTVEVRKLVLHDASIGLASKDRSTLRVWDVQIRGGQVGMTAYCKKAEFGPGTIEAVRLDMQGQKEPYLIERLSSATVDGRRMPADRQKVADILYGVEYGKASR